MFSARESVLALAPKMTDAAHDSCAFLEAERIECSTLRDVPALLAGRGTPLVFRGVLASTSWPALRWSGEQGLAKLSEEHGHRRVGVRFARKSVSTARTPWEGQCQRVPGVELGDFCSWLAGKQPPPKHELEAFPAHQWWGYCSYQHFEELFEDLPDANVGALDLAALARGAQPSGGPTLWLGSSGAVTPCHQDAYGFNLVVQVAGEKRWLLFPPSDAQRLGLHRLPFEDASTFTDYDPLTQGAPAGCTGCVAWLGPLDLLYVPRHWIHAVECTSPWSLSLNQWFEVADDAGARVHEATTRCLATPLLRGAPEDWWVNPGEELYSDDENIAFLCEALEGRLGLQQGSLREDRVRATVLRASTHPDTVALVASRILSELRGPSSGDEGRMES